MTLKSLAHPDWPYEGTPHEWRGFVKKPKQAERQDLCSDLRNANSPYLVFQKLNFGPELK